MHAASPSRITAVHPLWAIEGGRIVISGESFPIEPHPPEVQLAGVPARVVSASPRALTVVVPPGLDGGRTPVRVSTVPGETAYVDIGAPIATGLHQVDNPAFDADGNLYVTFSGSRGEQSPVSIYVVRRGGGREPFVTGLPNPTSMTVSGDGSLFVSSRFDGSVYRVAQDGSVSAFASDLGVVCGIAFGPDGDLYVGDRSGSILRVSGGRAVLFASIPPSVAAFHLAFGPDGWLYVSAPTLAPCDVVYRVSPSGVAEVFADGFGRPQGLAFDSTGDFYVVDALAGDSVVFRFDRHRRAHKMAAGRGLIGLAFDPGGGCVLASNDTVYRFDPPLGAG